MKILAVDDDLQVLDVLTQLAGSAGFTDVSTALSGQIALDILNEGNVVFDCLLFDIGMPDMDGIELCGLARSLPMYAKTPVIMLAAITDKDDIDRAFQVGANDYLNKPIDRVELRARLGMARDVVVARHKAAVISTLYADRPEVANQHIFECSDEVPIEGVQDLIRYAALENDLIQLSRAGLVSSQVLAVKIDRIAAIYARSSSEEFYYVLAEVAEAIGEALQPSGYTMAYAGNGAFVVVSNKATLEPSSDLEAIIQGLLDDKNAEYDNGDPLDIEVSIGNPVRPNTRNVQSIRKNFDRAIARAETRVLKKRTAPRPINTRFIGG